MTDGNIDSRCSTCRTLNFQWFDGIQQAESDQVAIAVERCIEAVSGDGRVWNDYSMAAARSEFKKRIQRAIEGKLKPVEQVKDVGHDPEVPLYEIRWQTVNVTERNTETGEVSHKTVLVRMYHSEPDRFPSYFVGHLAHEKDLEIHGNVSRLQSAEIGVAAKLYALGEQKNWGIVAA